MKNNSQLVSQSIRFCASFGIKPCGCGFCFTFNYHFTVSFICTVPSGLSLFTWFLRLAFLLILILMSHYWNTMCNPKCSYPTALKPWKRKSFSRLYSFSKMCFSFILAFCMYTVPQRWLQLSFCSFFFFLTQGLLMTRWKMRNASHFMVS